MKPMTGLLLAGRSMARNPLRAMLMMVRAMEAASALEAMSCTKLWSILSLCTSKRRR